MDDLSLFGSTFDTCLDNLSRVLIRCKEKDLLLNWEKCHFMLQRGIVLGHIISKDGIQVDKAKVDLISNLPPPRNIKDIRSFSATQDSTGASSKISVTLLDLLANFL